MEDTARMHSPVDEVVERVHKAVDEVNRLAYRSSDSNAHITVNAGGVGIWLCATACVAILVAVIVGSVVGGMWLSREAQRIERRAAEQEVKIDRANVLLSATWQHVPEVAEKVKQEHPEESADAK